MVVTLEFKSRRKGKKREEVPQHTMLAMCYVPQTHCKSVKHANYFARGV